MLATSLSKLRRHPLTIFTRTVHNNPTNPTPTPPTPSLPPHLALSPFKGPPSYSHLFQLRTRFIVHSLAAGVHIPSNLLSKLLQHRSIPAEKLFLWVEAIRGRDPASALGKLGLLDSGKSWDELHGTAQLGRRTRTRADELQECPDWLVLAIPGLASKKEDAPYLAGMLLSKRFSSLQPENQALLLARCIQHFLKINHFVAVDEAVDWACRDEAPQNRFMSNPRAFARCLAALASSRETPGTYAAPPTPLLQRCSRALLTTMETRAIPKTKAVFWPLFSRSLIPSEPKQAVELLKEAVKSGLDAEIELLHAVMRVMAASGDSKGAAAMQEEIRVRRKGFSRQETLGQASIKEDGVETLGDWGSVKKSDQVGPEDVEELETDDLLDRLPSYGAYDTTYLSSLSSDPKQAIQLFDHIRAAAQNLDLPSPTPNPHHQTPTSPSSSSATLSPPSPTQPLSTPTYSPPPIPSLDKISKVTFLHLISKSSTNLTPRHILALVSSLESPHPRKNLTLYTSAISALYKRGARLEAVALWERVEKEGKVRPDKILLGVLARLYCAQGRLERAGVLLRTYAFRPGIDSPLPSHHHPFRGVDFNSEPDSTPPPFTRIKIDTVIINVFLDAHNRNGHHSFVWDLWNSMQIEYGVAPDCASLSILLDSARYASAFAGRGFGPGPEGIELAGGGGFGGKLPSDTWSGRMEAWKRGDSIMKLVLEGNWPKRDLDEPLGPRNRVLGWLQDDSSSKTKKKHPPPRRPFEATLSIQPPLYPQIYPNAKVFRSLVQLLGFHSDHKAVVNVLAWMKYLGCKPDRSTLLLAVMYIDEGNPDEWRRVRLKKWLGDWLGEEAVPLDHEIAFLRGRNMNKIKN